jgi:hypothetical protein
LVLALALPVAAEIPRSKAIGTARTALERTIRVGNEQIIPKEKLRDAVPGDLYSVHHPQTLEPLYGIVPILASGGEVVGLMGVDREADKVIWYSFSPRDDVFPPVSSEAAGRRVQAMMGPSTRGSRLKAPMLVSGGDKHVYWRFETGSGEDALFVDCDIRSAEVLSSAEGSAQKVVDYPLRRSEPKPLARDSHPPAGRSAVPVLSDGVRPAAYEIPGIPYHYQIVDYWCGAVCLQMIFDWCGEEIRQQELADVVETSQGFYWTDWEKATSFSGMSTAKDDPTLQGYSDRKLGYAGLYINWQAYPMAERYEHVKNTILADCPLLMVGWYNVAHSFGHYRLLKGYDDSLNVFVFHDPWYSGYPSGPDLLIDQDVWMLDFWDWIFADRKYAAYTALPWRLTPDFPLSVSQGDTFTVDLKVLYPGPYMFGGQDATRDGTASIALSSGLTLAGGSSTVVLPSLASGDSVTVTWDVVASGAPGEWGMGFAAKGIIDYTAYSYGSTSDSIGGHSYGVVEVGGTLANGWGSEERLTDDDLSSATCFPGARSMAIEEDGTAHIVWQDTDAGGSYIRYRKRDGGIWQVPEDITPDTCYSHSPCITMDPGGDIHVAWVDIRAGNSDVFYRSWTSGGGWSLPERVSTSAEVDFNPSLAAGETEVHLVWESRLGGSYRAHAVFHAYRDAVGWSAALDVDGSAARDSYKPSLAIGADGIVNIVYERNTANNPNELEKVVHKSWDGMAWSGRTGLSSGVAYGRTPCIAAGGDTSLHVVWQDGENGVGGDIFYTRHDGTAWLGSPEQIVAGPTEAGTPSVAVDGNGDVYVMWVDHRHGESEIYLISDDGSGWSPHTRFTDATGLSMLPCVCAVGDGSVHALWTDQRHGIAELYYRGPSEGSSVPGDPRVPSASLIELSTPYPQPFTADTRLSLWVGQVTDIAIDVTDINGRSVKSIGCGLYEPGTYNLSWDGTNDSGRRVSPGVYFISCSSSLGRRVRRVVIVR